MRKSEIARSLDSKATSIFFITAAALVLNSLISNILRADSINSIIASIGAIIVTIIGPVAVILQMRGFAVVDKACRLSEKNENYYMGKNLLVVSVVCFVVAVILGIAAIVLSFMLAQYDVADVLSASDKQAMNNIVAITAVVNIAMQFFAVSTPFILYLWKIYNLTDKKTKVGTVALLALVLLVLHLAIGVLNSIYSIRSADNSFLPGFSGILNTVKYAVLLVFFVMRKNQLEKVAVTE